MAFQNILVTSYTNPDVDGVSCAIGYAEFLQKQGVEAVAAFFGKPHREAQFVLDRYHILLKKAEQLLKDSSKVIFVDASAKEQLPPAINPKQVIEIIDHRSFHDKESFLNATFQIELVGACATLITEKFMAKNLLISKESAILLYSGIVSNTFNFKGNLTTERDRQAAAWLQQQVEVPTGFVQDMFQHKSTITQPLKEVLLADFKVFAIGGKKVGIAQLEMVGVDGFIRQNTSVMKNLLHEIQREKELDMVFLNGIDVEEARNTLLAPDGWVVMILQRSLGLSFEKSLARSDTIIMRKEIVPLLQKVMEGKA